MSSWYTSKWNFDVMLLCLFYARLKVSWLVRTTSSAMVEMIIPCYQDDRKRGCSFSLLSLVVTMIVMWSTIRSLAVPFFFVISTIFILASPHD